jgi:hypothetical protein
MTDLDGFEGRLLHALTDLDARREVTPTADTANRSRPPVARRRLALVAVTTVLVVATTALAAASGLFPTAPAEVRRIFAGLDGDRDVDADRAVRIGTIDDHEAYAAPAEGGGFCLYFAPNPRSGPTGHHCIPRVAHADEVLFTVLPGHDGILVFGRTGAAGATHVVITFPGDGGTLRTPVGDSGLFGATVPEQARDTFETTQQPGPKDPPTKDGRPYVVFDPSRVADLRVVAVDAHGTTVAHGVTSEDWVGAGGP